MYDPSDPILVQERQNTRALTHMLNITEHGNEFAYKNIIKLYWHLLNKYVPYSVRYKF